MELRWIAHLSPAYALCVALRSEILRKPLGLVFTEAQLAAEGDSLHLACFEDGSLVGTLMLTPTADGSLQMRQVAVAEALQGRGIGSLLVEESEREARRRGVSRLILHARMSAQAFYEKGGYSLVGDPFVEVGIPHQAMEKRLL